MGIMFGHFLFWPTLALYLDQVFPNDFGAKRHPLFFLPFFKEQSEDEKYKKLSLKDEIGEECKFVETLEEMYLNAPEDKTITISRATKIYGSGKVAVNNLNMTMH